MKTSINYFRFMMVVLLFGSIHHVNAQEVKVSVPTLKLNNGMEMPQLGIGTFAISYEAAKEACLEAFRNGYRHVDCATAYRVEGAVGEAMKESGIPREEFLLPANYGFPIMQMAKHWNRLTKYWNAFRQITSTCFIFISLLAIISMPGRRWKRPLHQGRCVRWDSVILTPAKNASMPLSIT